ncbi:hypothetical protein CPB86DRAFT_779616 [Serendipita vermifera]|nr:hypothetical protein CPB86DRAFT_779616 [Serendipita vermifera]
MPNPQVNTVLNPTIVLDLTLPLQSVVNASPLLEAQSGSPGQVSFHVSIQLGTLPGAVPVIHASIPPNLSLAGSQTQAPEELERTLKERLQRKKLDQGVESSRPNDCRAVLALPTPPSTSQSERWESDATNFPLTSAGENSSVSGHPELSDASLQYREVPSTSSPEARPAMPDSRVKASSNFQTRNFSEKRDSYRGDPKYRDVRYTPYQRTEPSYQRSQHYQAKASTHQAYRRSVSPMHSLSGPNSSSLRDLQPLSSTREDGRAQTWEREQYPSLDDQDQDMHSEAPSEPHSRPRSVDHADIERQDPYLNENEGRSPRRGSSPNSVNSDTHIKETNDRTRFYTPSPRASDSGLPCDSDEDRDNEEDHVSLRRRIQPAIDEPQQKMNSPSHHSACPFIHPTPRQKHPPHTPHPGYTAAEYNEAVAINESGQRLPQRLLKSGAIINVKKRKAKDATSPYASPLQSRFRSNDNGPNSLPSRDHSTWVDASRVSVTRRVEERDYRGDGENRDYINIPNGSGRGRSDDPPHVIRRGSYNNAPFRASRPLNDYRRGRVDTYNN